MNRIDPDVGQIDPRYPIVRYRKGDRTNHWLVAFFFVCAGLSGLALFHPALYFFTHLFGGGPWTRILHPFLGVLMVLCFVGMFFRFWRQNTWKKEDSEWVKDSRKLLGGNEDAMPPAGKYNAGQKAVFWVFAICLVILFVTGFMFWRPWFAPAFPITVIRIAVVLHAISATVLIIAAIIHIYAAIWVKGSVRAMTRGTVSHAWARKHHPLWHRDVQADRTGQIIH